jgi:opacity protein-like surface antigen
MRKILFSIAALATVLFTSNSYAAEKNPFYFRLQPGAVIINDVDFSSSASGYGITVTADGSFTFEPGMTVAGAVGYKLSDMVSIEGELGYANAEYDAVEGTLSATSGGTTYSVAGSANVDGEVTMITGIANLILTPMSKEKFAPYFGGGVGFVNVENEINSIGTLTVNSDENNTDLVANFIAGFDFKIEEDMSLGARYRYVWADTGQSGIEDATAHVVALSLKIDF